MNPTITVRPATIADLDQLVSLFEQYRAFYKREPDVEGARAFLGERLSRTDSAILLAVDSASPASAAVGFVQLYPTFSSLRMGRALILNDLFVAPEYRRHGAARKLMDAARLFAEMSGAVSLSLETQKNNAQARALYEQLGYEAEEEFVTYSLPMQVLRDKGGSG